MTRPTNIALVDPSPEQVALVRDLLKRDAANYVFEDCPLGRRVAFLEADEIEPNFIIFDREEDRAALVELLDATGIKWCDHWEYVGEGHV